ncbi:MAG: hypothetical protein R2761_02955 [Acidimicrobiales bacterium]
MTGPLVGAEREETMLFDPIRATLVATEDELADLAARAARGDEGLHPTVAGIVAVVGAPARSVVIERFDQGLVAPLFVAFDGKGRAVVTEGAGDVDGRAALSMTATHLELLPALLSQALRLHAGLPSASRRPLEATAGQIEAAWAGAAGMAGAAGVAEPGLAAVLAAMTHGWRASGSWAGAEIDRSATVMSAGAEGLWHVDRGPADHGPVPIGPDDRIELRPVTVAEARALLGDVVTGRRSC